jgi:hypothetical protein
MRSGARRRNHDQYISKVIVRCNIFLLRTRRIASYDSKIASLCPKYVSGPTWAGSHFLSYCSHMRNARVRFDWQSKFCKYITIPDGARIEHYVAPGKRTGKREALKRPAAG